MTLGRAAAAIAFLAACAIVVAVVVIADSKAHGFTLVDVLVAPIAFAFYAGPALLVAAMALRSRTRWATTLTAALAVLLAFALEAFGATPWHFPQWRANPGDAETRVLIGVLLFLWPVTAVSGLLWFALNRKPA